MKENFVFILSSMRSGSTLLKALLATRKDISNLPEIHFSQIENISDSSAIKVIKAPAYYNEFDNYPGKIDIDVKIIVLIRNPYDTIMSLKKMNKEVGISENSSLNSFQTLFSYWYYLYINIFDEISNNKNNIIVIRYEELVTNPIQITHSIFKFIKCQDSIGTDEYDFPKNYKWKWGKDDGGELIKKLKVKDFKRNRDKKELINLLKHNEDRILELLKLYGYKTIDILEQ